jgi:hypothetical protein
MGLTRAQARGVAERAGFQLVVSPGQSPRDADTVSRQFPLARSTISNRSLVLMAEFSAVSRGWPLWIVWIAVAVPLLAVIARFLITKTATPVQAAFPPITYAAGAKAPSFSVEERGSSRGLELSLSVKNDPGIQAVQASGAH